MIQSTFYLVINNKGSATVKVGKRGAPTLQKNEVAVKLNISLPASLFERPMYEANVRVNDAGEASRFLSTDITENIQRAIAESAGIQVRVVTVRETNGRTQ